ncbi:hypothetical protein Tco_1256792 [Tanacetum coccineum]
MADETENVESVPIYSNDPLLSGEERLKLNELMELCTNLSQRVLDLENTKTSQAAEITKLKERIAPNREGKLPEIDAMKRLARQKEEDENIAEWDNVQAMIDADYELAARLQHKEQER